MIEILEKTRDYVVIFKPSGIPSESDRSGDPDAVTLTSELLSEMGESTKLWLIHRLDRTVGGVMILARTREYAAVLSEVVRERIITKQYFAIVDGDAEGGTLEDLIYRDARASKAFIVDRERSGVKKARLSYEKIASVSTEKGSKTLIYVTLDTGRYHQIRAQLSHNGTPITGDGKYGSRDNRARSIALFASHLEIAVKGRVIDVSRLPDISVYPWSLFEEKSYLSRG